MDISPSEIVSNSTFPVESVSILARYSSLVQSWRHFHIPFFRTPETYFKDLQHEQELLVSNDLKMITRCSTVGAMTDARSAVGFTLNLKVTVNKLKLNFPLQRQLKEFVEKF